MRNHGMVLGVWVFSLVPVLSAGCAGPIDAEWPGDPGPQVVPAGAEPDPGAPIAGRFWAEIMPLRGLMAVYPLHPGNIIYRGERIEAVSYNYGVLTTRDTDYTRTAPQGTVTFQNNMGQCFEGGVQVMPCPNNTWPAVCRNAMTFCAFEQVVNIGAAALSDPVLQFSTGPTITACAHDTVTPDGCSATSLKVANASSNLQGQTPAPIFPDCVYCYGNQNKATDALIGLRDTIIPNQGAGAQFDINTDLVVLTLNSTATSGATLDIRYAVPTLDAGATQITNCTSPSNCGNPPACVNAGTGAIKIKGSGFGPPGECISGAPGSCPVSGTTSVAGASVTYTGGVSGTVSFWSDQTIVVSTPTGAMDGAATVTIPIGNSTVMLTTAAINVCP